MRKIWSWKITVWKVVVKTVKCCFQLPKKSEMVKSKLAHNVIIKTMKISLFRQAYFLYSNFQKF